ncbi:aldose epimerase family protein [Labrys wisconsinensis]|uniref:Aldose 1-epimerase n=1 Tax=Labrys wisconsinensis TaxID=425677 RepID=A0ABU0J952_9HYPH|nr:aldose epimerase family protein [Labrys wisconsinensis]MDQ0469682.1 aldose 1-epimerase [Labrys wisconsinensis]
MTNRLFGSYDGVDILEVTIRSEAGAEAKIITWGAAVRDLVVPGKAGPQRVVLGFDEFDHYRYHSPHFGANPGRFANRIAHGRFTLDGVSYELDRKNNSPHTLHGGTHGFGVRPWSIIAQDGRSVTLAIVSEDGDMGFPGRVVATCRYTLLEPATLRVDYGAATDKPTPVNLAHHSYFNLDGSPDILDHHLLLAADFYTPTDAELIPTGEIRAVAGTPYDFRTDRPIGLEVDGQRMHYDTNFVLRSASTLGHAATAWSPKSGVTMEAWTTEPGVQFYDAAKLNTPVPGLNGEKYGPYAGFCLEAQLFPDAPNKPHFPNSILRPGQVYRQTTEYRFGRG